MSHAVMPVYAASTARPVLYILSLWLFALVLVGNLAIMARDAWLDIASQQATEAQRSSRFVAQSLARALQEDRRRVALFAELHRQPIEQLIADPGSQPSHDGLHAAIARFFPDAFAFTIVDRSGTPLIDDFDGLIGEVCLDNIQRFARDLASQPILIHPHPEVYHYDIMVPLGENIFFISFKPDSLALTLRENASLGQVLYLLKSQKSLIELSPEGTRLALKRAFHLSRDEHKALLLRLPVEGTAWELAVLPDVAAITAQQTKIIWHYAGTGLVVLLLTALMQWLLRLESDRRSHLEHATQALTVLSNTDALSGLANRRALDETLEREWHWMERSSCPLTLMMIDIDHFKRFNDHWGHLAGDEAIRTVASILKRVINRPRDVVGRFGGEEFLLILPDTPNHAGAFLAKAIHAAIGEASIAHPDSPTASHLTVSIGLVCATQGVSQSPAELLKTADEALYTAKQTGRNKTITLLEPAQNNAR